jgi:predicted DNA-binding transcriptional regulator YafY
VRHEKAGAVIELARRLAASAEGLTLDEMAEAMGVGRRTAERMRDAVWALFPQMEDIPDGPAKRFRIPGGLDGFAQGPTTEELLELGKAVAALKAQGATPRARALESLELKVRSALKTRELRRLSPDVDALGRAETIQLQAGPKPFEETAVIGPLRHALMAGLGVSFSYHGGRTPGARRSVAPYGLMFGRTNYLVAAELGGGEPRNWRLDRIKDLEILDTPASAPEDFSLDAYANRSFGVYQDDTADVVLRILPHGAEEALNWRFHPSQVVEPQADGSVIVRFTASGMRELAWHLFTWGDKVEIVAPDSLRELLVAELRTALAAHGGET